MGVAMGVTMGVAIIVSMVMQMDADHFCIYVKCARGVVAYAVFPFVLRAGVVAFTNEMSFTTSVTSWA